MSENNFSRRKFLTGAAAIGAAGAMGVGTLSSCARRRKFINCLRLDRT